MCKPAIIMMLLSLLPTSLYATQSSDPCRNPKSLLLQVERSQSLLVLSSEHKNVAKTVLLLTLRANQCAVYIHKSAAYTIDFNAVSESATGNPDVKLAIQQRARALGQHTESDTESALPAHRDYFRLPPRGENDVKYRVHTDAIYGTYLRSAIANYSRLLQDRPTFEPKEPNRTW
jgi:hypothetical protein